MTELEAYARMLMANDSGPGDPTWEDSGAHEQRYYLLEAADVRAYAHRLAQVMAVSQNGSWATDEDIDWYRDLTLNALSEVGPPTWV